MAGILTPSWAENAPDGYTGADRKGDVEDVSSHVWGNRPSPAPAPQRTMGRTMVPQGQDPIDDPADFNLPDIPLPRPKTGPEGQAIGGDVKEEIFQGLQEEQDNRKPKENYKKVVDEPVPDKSFAASYDQIVNKADEFEMGGKPVTHTKDEFASLYNTEQGRQNGDFQNANVDWYEDSSFYEGLLRWGLGVMGGEDYGTAFDKANKVYEQSHAQDQRQQWADEMTEDYDPRSIQQWIASGNEKDLRSYSSMADEENTRQAKVEDMESRLSPEDRRRVQNININQKEQNLINSQNQYQYKANAERRAQNDETRDQAVFDAKYGKGGSTKGTKPTELQMKAGLYSNLMAMNDSKSLNYVPDIGDDAMESFSDKVLPEGPAGDRIGNRWLDDDAAKAKRDKNSYVQGIMRIATGSAYGGKEPGDWQTILFPQTSDPKEVKQKALTRTILQQQLSDISNGSEAMPMNVISGISQGTYKPHFDPQTKTLTAVTDTSGNMIWRK